jgi:hypothetical protein
VTSPRNATTAAGSGQRFYIWRNERYWSVTTIIGGGIPKPALINWAKKFTAEYAVEHFDSFAQLVKDDPEGAIDWLKGAAYRDRDKKAELGSHLHEAMEAYVLGKPFPKWPPLVKPRMLAFEQFLKDFQPEYEATEASVFNRTERYAGTLDALAVIDGKKYLLDMKSGKAVYPEVGLQLAAYRYAEFIGLPDGSEEEMRPVDGCAALHLDANGDYELIEVHADESIFRYFLYVREVFRWQQEASKTVLVGPMRVQEAA